LPNGLRIGTVPQAEIVLRYFSRRQERAVAHIGDETYASFHQKNPQKKVEREVARFSSLEVA
jgi:hypothetical protein